MPRRKLARGSRLASSALAWHVVAIVSALAGCSGGRVPQNGQGPAVFPIVVSAQDLDIGTIWATTNYSRTLHLENTSPREVELAELKASCKCLSVEPPSVRISPKQQCEVTLTLDVSTPPKDNAEVKEPNYRVRLIPIVRGYRRRPPQWELTATIRKLLTLSSSFVRFEQPLIQGQTFPAQTVDILSAVPLQSLEAEGGKGLASLDVTKRSDTAYVVSIRPLENLPPGPFGFEVGLTPQLTSGERVKTSGFTVNGRVSREVEPSPRSIHWGVVPVGRTLESRIVVRSLVDKPFSVKSATSDSENIDVRMGKSSSDKVTFVVKTANVVLGDHKAKIVAVVENYDGETFELTIPISYFAFSDEDRK